MNGKCRVFWNKLCDGSRRSPLSSVTKMCTKLWNERPVLVVLLSGLITVALGLVSSQETFTLLSSATLVATLVAIIWYTYETRSIRLHQERDSDIQNHPWFEIVKVKSLRSEEQETLLTRETFSFRIKNNGRTPAFDVGIQGRWVVEGDSGNMDGSFNEEIGVILPAASRCVDVSIEWEVVTKIGINLDLTYNDYGQGGGRLSYWFISQSEGETERCETADFWLSDGRRFPTSNAPDSKGL